MSDRPAAPDSRISRSASIEAELARIAATEIDYALTEMRAATRRPASAVHHCRKTIKRLRALVRLAGGEADARREIDRKLRDAGRLLAAARDAEVIRKTVARLCTDNALARSAVRRVSRAATRLDRDAAGRVAQQLSDVRVTIAEHFGEHTRTPELLVASIERAHRKAARLMRRFRDRGGKALAHEWRKSVQRYANQLKVMSDLEPGRAAAELERLDALAECLGEFNDLTILSASLKAGHVGRDEQSRATLRKLARARQRVLRKQAIELGESVFHSSSSSSAVSAAGLEQDPHRWL